jgi:hypothetical protein
MKGIPMAEPSHHVVISGTGRAGTTFLVQILTTLGFDTGFRSPREGVYENCHAGMERDLREKNLPYIVKSPWICEYLDSLQPDHGIVIDHLIVPVRELFAAAESRRHVTKKTLGPEAAYAEVPGGLWGTTDPSDQERALAERFHRLIHAAVRADIPLTFLHFPRIVGDPDYLRRRLEGVFGALEEGAFNAAFAETARPELVHDFGKKP